MVARHEFGLRRLKLEDLIAKLAQIEEQASLTLAEYPRGLTVERQRLIIGLARQARSHLEDQVKRGSRVAVLPDGEAGHLRAVDSQLDTGTTN